LHVLGTPQAFVLSQDQTLSNKKPTRGRAADLELTHTFRGSPSYLVVKDPSPQTPGRSGRAVL
jgi:hypothetical protein